MKSENYVLIVKLSVETADGERIKVLLDIWCIVTLHIIYGHNNNNLYLYYLLHLPATRQSQLEIIFSDHLRVLIQ